MSKSIKILFSFTFISLMFTGCFGSGETATNIDTAGKTPYETSEFSLFVPNDWETIEKSDFTSNVPDETWVAFRNNIQNEIFTANLNISVISVGENMNSKDFALSSKSKAKSELISFQEISTEDVDNGTIIKFQGKKSASEPIVVFEQLFAVNNTSGYTVTAAYLPDEDETVVNYLDEMLKSFTLK